MCGICGFVGTNEPKTLSRMVSTLTHRGPDSEGLWEGHNVSFGMRRLSIVDIETGQQPVFNEDKTVVCILNGEIYNHIELRKDLLAKGHKFRSHHSDTEVLVHLYEEYGEDFPRHLNGMFAIAIWDEINQLLLLVRDRAGIKPLYFSQTTKGLVFGSEPKALLTHPDIGRNPDFISINHYLSFKHIPSPRSAFAGMEQLRAGGIALFRNGSLTHKRWWRIEFSENLTIGEDEAVINVRKLLEDSVRLQMRSDVPVGAYLSGGVDSSSVVALMSQLGANNVNTFTLVYDDGFPHKDADREFAKKVSSMYGTNHHEQMVSPADVPEFIDSIASAFDEPFSGVISTFFLTQLIADHVKVALSGDGADEIFGSYIGPRIAHPLAFAVNNRERLDDLTADELNRIKAFNIDINLLKSTLARCDEASQRMGLYIADDDQKNTIYTPFMRKIASQQRTENLISTILTDCITNDAVNRALFIDFETLLPDQVLTFVDRLSMAHSVEVRPPFLDHRLIEYVATLPGDLKIKNGNVKYILKRAVEDLLPEGLINRPKEGFLMPINAWLLDHLRDFVEDLLGPKQLEEQGIFKPDAVKRLLSEHYGGTYNHGNRIWSMVMLQIWWRKYIS